MIKLLGSFGIVGLLVGCIDATDTSAMALDNNSASPSDVRIVKKELFNYKDETYESRAIERYSYDSQDRLVEVVWETDYDMWDTTRHTLTYEETDLPVSMKFNYHPANGDWVLGNQYEYRYNEFGIDQYTERYWSSFKNEWESTIDTIRYSYDSGVLVSKKELGDDSWEVEYSFSDEMIDEIIYTDIGYRSESSIYTYNSSGQVIEKRGYYSFHNEDTRTLSSRTEIFYSDNTIEYKRYSYGDGADNRHTSKTVVHLEPQKSNCLLLMKTFYQVEYGKVFP